MSDKEKKPKRPLKGRVFQCTGFPNCNKSFTRSEHLARHRRKHTGERPFTCPHCSKNFSRLDNLRQHKQTVHAYENYIKKRPHALLATPQERGDLLPGTPLQFGNKLFSPPSSGSPQYPHMYYGYQGPEDAPRSSQPSIPGQNLQTSSQQTQAQLEVGRTKGAENGEELLKRLRDPPKFNPKNRPKPLALIHSFADDNAINNRTHTPTFVVEPPLKTAPAVPLFPAYSPSAGNSGYGLSYDLGYGAPHGYGNGLHGVGGRGYPGTPGFKLHHFNSMMVSPLLPLFHQLFNQVPSKSSTLFALHPISRISSALALALNVLLPSISSLQSGQNREDVTGGTSGVMPGALESAPTSQDGADKEGEGKKGWLKNMLNEEPKKLAIDALITLSEEEVSSIKASEESI